MIFETLDPFQISASYLQIYQEKIHDLLNINNKVELNIRENPKAGIFDSCSFFNSCVLEL